MEFRKKLWQLRDWLEILKAINTRSDSSVWLGVGYELPSISLLWILIIPRTTVCVLRRQLRVIILNRTCSRTPSFRSPLSLIETSESRCNPSLLFAIKKY